jgi:hypothetical protein
MDDISRRAQIDKIGTDVTQDVQRRGKGKRVKKKE